MVVLSSRASSEDSSKLSVKLDERNTHTALLALILLASDILIHMSLVLHIFLCINFADLKSFSSFLRFEFTGSLLLRDERAEILFVIFI